MQEENIIVHAALVLKPDCVQTFLDAAKKVVLLTRQEEGCLKYDLLADILNPQKFDFIEEYKDAAAFQVHRNMPYMDELRIIRNKCVEKYLGVEEFSRINKK